MKMLNDIWFKLREHYLFHYSHNTFVEYLKSDAELERYIKVNHIKPNNIISLLVVDDFEDSYAEDKDYTVASHSNKIYKLIFCCRGLPRHSSSELWDCTEV